MFVLYGVLMLYKECIFSNEFKMYSSTKHSNSEPFNILENILT